jgi:hypothetical protein
MCYIYLSKMFHCFQLFYTTFKEANFPMHFHTIKESKTKMRHQKFEREKALDKVN